MAIKKQINPHFSRNWKQFDEWFGKMAKKLGKAIPWETQEHTIQAIYSTTMPTLINWDTLWSDYRNWLSSKYKENKDLRWSEQRRQIETLILLQLRDLDSPQFILIFKLNGKPSADAQVMTYWEALNAKENLEGDSNGIGGDESLDNITIINLKTLLK